VVIADHAPTTSTHGLTPSPPSGSTISPANDQSQSQSQSQSSNTKPEELTLTIDPPPATDADPSFTADFTDTNFLEGEFAFDSSAFDGTFDFGQYLAEFGGDEGDTELGVV
jgi:hypothetical protein